MSTFAVLLVLFWVVVWLYSFFGEKLDGTNESTYEQVQRELRERQQKEGRG